MTPLDIALLCALGAAFVLYIGVWIGDLERDVKRRTVERDGWETVARNLAAILDGIAEHPELADDPAYRAAMRTCFQCQCKARGVAP